VVLFGTKYWAGFITWLRESVLAEGKVGKDDMLLLSVTDSPQEAVDIILRARADKPAEEITGRRATDDRKMVES
jgi:predicted Rossmann-fold nucleotide-binding protein